MWPRPKRLYRAWLIFLTILCVFLSLVIWFKHAQGDNNVDQEYFSLKLLDNQKDYIDRRGMHVVVGHYIGESVDSFKNPNISDEIINKNMFSPVPYAGKNGEPVIVPSKDFQLMQRLFQINKFNLMASDRIPLNRSLPDVRKKGCNTRYSNISNLPDTSVIIVFHNEAWSTLLRTVHSVINRSPRKLLKEIILVDDNSDRKFLKDSLDKYVEQLSVPVQIIRSKVRAGLVHARLLGAQQAKGKVLTFLDAHCECTDGWLEPLLTAIAENNTRVVSPVIDIINDNNFSYVRSFELHLGAFNWELHFRWFALVGELTKDYRRTSTEPFKTPAMAGGLFAMDREYFYALGSYDDQMKIWGGENLELSFRVWQCGGSVEIAPCSHVGHLFRKSSPYTFPGGVGGILYGNLARVALVWMDEWADFYFKFNPEGASIRDQQQVKSRLNLRERLKCKSFKWYLDNIWPQHFFPTDERFFGQIVHVDSKKCLMRPFSKNSFVQPSGFPTMESCLPSSSLSQMFVMTNDGFIMTDESVCLSAPDKDTKNIKPQVKMTACYGLERQRWTYNTEKKVFIHVPTSMCLQYLNSKEGLVIAACTFNLEQQWNRKIIPWK